MSGGIRRMSARHARWVVGVAIVAVACSGKNPDDDDDDDDDDAGEAGQQSSGGSSANGGSGNTGGSSANGGSVSGSSGNGGSVSGSSGSNGGNISSGGVSGTNGGSAAGGTAATGGSTGGDGATGGSSGGTGGTGGSTGGDTSTGGTGGDTSTGGTGGDTSGTGGTGGDGGTGGGEAIECGDGFETHVGGYVTSPGSSGCWKGYAYTITDSLGSLITPAEFSSCTEGPCSLCVSGTVAPDLDYEGFAGLGFNANQINETDAPQGTVLPSGTGLTVGWTNAGGSGLRVQIQNATTQWCYTLTGASGTVTIPYSAFMTQCWEGGASVYYAGEAITGMQLTVPGNGLYTTPFNFCLSSASDGGGA
jgi:hypothetical protein